PSRCNRCLPEFCVDLRIRAHQKISPEAVWPRSVSRAPGASAPPWAKHSFRSTDAESLPWRRRTAWGGQVRTRWKIAGTPQKSDRSISSGRTSSFNSGLGAAETVRLANVSRKVLSLVELVCRRLDTSPAFPPQWYPLDTRQLADAPYFGLRCHMPGPEAPHFSLLVEALVNNPIGGNQ